MAAIYKKAEPRGTDYVGFGKFSSRTYSEVLGEALSYADWVVKTAAESDTADPKLVRLAQWIQKARDVKTPAAQVTTKGYHLQEPDLPVEEIKTTMGSPGRASTSARSSHDKDTATIMKNLLEAVQGLQEEVKDLRGLQEDVRDLKEDKYRKHRAVMPPAP